MPRSDETREYHRNYHREHAEYLNAQSRERYRTNEGARKKKSEASKKRRAARTTEKVLDDLAVNSEKSRIRYQEKPEHVKLIAAKCIANKIAKFNLLKLERPCYDCGGVFPPEAMDWDHRPGTNKCFDISKGVRTYSEEAVIDEINKCQLVCACCHRIRTTTRTKEDK